MSLKVAKRIGKILSISGLIIGFAGILFLAQSKSAVGPQSSFMYNNPQWTVNGAAIAIAGFAIAAAGFITLVLSRKKEHNAPSKP